MKKYKVEYIHITPPMMMGLEPPEKAKLSVMSTQILAENPESAVKIAMKMIVCNVNSEYYAEQDGEFICVYDLTGKLIEELSAFKATEIK